MNAVQIFKHSVPVTTVAVAAAAATALTFN
jgi:hypothetical protein